MFTGLIESVGDITAIKALKNGLSIQISVTDFLSDVQVGDSISVNGICSTVTDLSSDTFSVDYMPETADKTTVSQWQIQDRVHLEKCLTLQTRLGGHVVTGHIDTCGDVVSFDIEGPWAVLKLAYPPQFRAYLIEKGSIAIDGVSLTVVDVDDQWFSVHLIPHTLSETICGSYKAGVKVNLEFDMMAKYLYRFYSLDKKDEHVKD